ncbi:MAG: hypothetical protein K9J82_00455 [Methylotenera sp.]|jgi:hypothetical protein|nr:hypothetical protein [Methylotenera sp.]
MHVYYDENREYNEVRLHPYQPNAAEASQAGFVDFKAEPYRIPEVLEDFRPYASEPAVQTFYSMLRWINGPESELESADCLFRGPEQNSSTRTSHHALQAHGRLCLMFRHLPGNCHAESFDWLLTRLGTALNFMDTELVMSEAVIGFSKSRTLFTEISNGTVRADGQFESDRDDPGHGNQVTLWFWAFGDTEAAVFANLDRIFSNIWAACRITSDAITQGNRLAREAASRGA